MILALESALQKYHGLVSNPVLEVSIHSDSRYAVNCMSNGIHRWSQNGWRSSRGREVVNRDLLQDAFELNNELSALGNVEYTWHPRCEVADANRCCTELLDEMEEEG